MRSLFAKIKTFPGKHSTKLLIFLVLAVQVVLAVALFRYATYIKEIEVPKDAHWWTPWIPAIAAVIATAGALITLYTNKRLSERQFVQRQAVEQDRFDRQALESLFTDILNRFASENPIIRANAAIRLAEMARKNWPGRPEEKLPENFPFFPDAASQLAAALYMEEHRAVRDEVVKALGRMTQFAKQDDQALLHLLIRELADANRSAKAAFVEALAEGCSRVEKVTTEDLRPLIPFASFCSLDEISWACLFSLANSKECRAAAITKAIRRKAQTEDERRQADLRLLPDIQSCADRLLATRDALATALSALAAPADLPSNATQRSEWKRTVPLMLKGCFLVDAKLFDAQLQGADLQGAFLQQANLARTQLQHALLMQAECQGAYLADAQANGATFTETQLQHAYLVGAQVREAFLGWANLLEANLCGADFTGADLAGARLFGARVEEGAEADLLGVGGLDLLAEKHFGTRPFQASVEKILGKRDFAATKFGATNWWQGNFTRPPRGTHWWEANFASGDETDQRLWHWLSEHFPQAAAQGEAIVEAGDESGEVLSEPPQTRFVRGDG